MHNTLQSASILLPSIYIVMIVEKLTISTTYKLCYKCTGGCFSVLSDILISDEI